MVFDERLSPARVSAAAAAKLPRAVLLALIVAYIVSGLFGRDPWQENDAAGFGVMWNMASTGDWLLPAVAGEAVVVDGPLAFWVGAASIALLGKAVGVLTAARLPMIAWFFLATAAVWYATLRLARREEAQPVAFAFGGEASARDYARMIADVAVLLLLGTVGPITALHETTAEPATFALACVALYSLVLCLNRPIAGAAACGLTAGLLFLAHGAQPAAWLLLAATVVIARVAPAAIRLPAIALLVVIAAAISLSWPVALLILRGEASAAYLADWRAIALLGFAWPTGENAAWLLRNLSWHSWPLWPLAIWTLYAWRHALRAPHVALALTLLAFMATGLLTTRSPGAEDLLQVTAPLVLLAAFGAVALRRAAETVIDWFAITAYCLFAAALWAYFVAMQTGFPPKMSTSVLRLTAGFVPLLDWPRVAVAAAATGLWLVLVLWRVRQSSGALWRGPALAAAGMVTLWVVFSSLFLAAVDHRRSFAGLSRAVAAELARSGGADDCVLPHHLRPSHRTVFAYHGNVRFSAAADSSCAFALHRDVATSLLDDGPPPGQWTPVWEGHRPGLAHEVFRLYRRGG